MYQRDLGDASPQGIGDIIGQAFRIARGNLGAIFRYILVPSLCTLAVTLLFQWIVSYGAAYVAESKSITAAVSMGLVFLLALGLSALTWWFLGLRLLSLVRFILGFAPTLDDAGKYMLRRKWSLVGLNLVAGFLIGAVIFGFGIALVLFAVVVGFVGAALGGPARGLATAVATIIGMSAGAGAFIFAAGFYVFLNCVLACEDQPIGGVITRAWQLTSRHAPRFVLFCVVFYLVYCIINYPLSLPLLIATGADMIRHQMSGAAAGGYKQPLYLLIFNSTWETGVGFLMRPLFLFGFAFLYYDLRLRQDGLDIRRKLDAIKAANAAGS